jgi:hypothetical protein
MPLLFSQEFGEMGRGAIAINKNDLFSIKDEALYLLTAAHLFNM